MGGNHSGKTPSDGRNIAGLKQHHKNGRSGNGLLDVIKINSGKLQFNDQDFEFVEFARNLLEDIQITSIKHKLNGKLPSSCFVFGDKERIGQVIIYLITNAIKYSP